jgi:hypothetical protein
LSNFEWTAGSAWDVLPLRPALVGWAGAFVEPVTPSPISVSFLWLVYPDLIGRLIKTIEACMTFDALSSRLSLLLKRCGEALPSTDSRSPRSLFARAQS